MKLQITFEIEVGVYSPTCEVAPRAIAESIADTLRDCQSNAMCIGTGWNGNDYQFEVMLEKITALDADEM